MDTNQTIEVLQRIAERDAARRDRMAEAAANRCVVAAKMQYVQWHIQPCNETNSIKSP